MNLWTINVELQGCHNIELLVEFNEGVQELGAWLYNLSNMVSFFFAVLIA